MKLSGDKAVIDREKMQKFMERIGVAPKYPCKNCRWRSACSREIWCKTWAEWFRYSFDETCKKIRKAARKWT